ncbi:hypothetical protein [Spiroplasma sp. AdecLV25b]|uniref:hypothetical protein n=1 Tax=Spiroplasma sp. AdecLV25b TaxID=3027162 RepID=UPI0027DFA1D5|nr:hypothetical protein [Spiroplasma sp. AdecLV25b]
MKKLINSFKKQNWGIKIGFYSLVVSIICLAIGLILIATANFTPKSGGDTVNSGNGFNILADWGINNFLTADGHNEMEIFYFSNKFLSYPIAQVSAGVVFAIILASTFIGISGLSLIFGYFKRWLYS